MVTMDRTEAERSNKSRRAALILAFIGLIVVTVLMFLVPGVLRTASMNTGEDGCLKSGDLVLMNRMAYSERNAPDYGDITVFAYSSNGKNISVPVRVIGNDGDIIEIKSGNVYRNGELLEEPYAKGSTYTAVSDNSGNNKYKVPKESVFVLGDNREKAIDSRTQGCISRRDLGGKIVFRLLPMVEMGAVE